jgi:hypothetical protein
LEINQLRAGPETGAVIASLNLSEVWQCGPSRRTLESG